MDCLKEGSSWFYCEFCAKCREYSYIKVVYPEKQLQKYWFNTVVRVVCLCVLCSSLVVWSLLLATTKTFALVRISLSQYI